MTSTRFDQDPDAIYGTCITCGEDQHTEADSKQHMSQTLEDAKMTGQSRGHGIQILNPTRGYRIEAATSSIVDEAIERAMGDMRRLVDNDEATENEIRESLWMHSDFREAWDEWNNEGDGES